MESKEIVHYSIKFFFQEKSFKVKIMVKDNNNESSGSRMSKELHYYNEKDIKYLILL